MHHPFHCWVSVPGWVSRTVLKMGFYARMVLRKDTGGERWFLKPLINPPDSHFLDGFNPGFSLRLFPEKRDYSRNRKRGITPYFKGVSGIFHARFWHSRDVTILTTSCQPWAYTGGNPPFLTRISGCRGAWKGVF